MWVSSVCWNRGTLGRLLIWHSFKLVFTKFVQKRKSIRNYIMGRAENKEVSGSAQNSSFSNKIIFGPRHIYLTQHNESPDFKIIQSCLKVMLSPSVEPQAYSWEKGVSFATPHLLSKKAFPPQVGVSLRRVLAIQFAPSCYISRVVEIILLGTF